MIGDVRVIEGPMSAKFVTYLNENVSFVDQRTQVLLEAIRFLESAIMCVGQADVMTQVLFFFFIFI